MKIRFFVYYILLFLTIVSCNSKSEKGIPMNYSERSDSELEKLVIEKGDTSAYYELFVVYLDYPFEKFLPYALIMANKYNYQQAYFDVYDRLWNLYDNPDLLDNTSKKMAIEYLQKAASRGHTQAKDILKEYNEKTRICNVPNQ
jgi:hypothetical protein